MTAMYNYVRSYKSGITLFIYNGGAYMEKNIKRKGKNRLMAVVAVMIILAMVLSIVVPIFAAPYAAVSAPYYDISAGSENGSEEAVIFDSDAEIKSETIELYETAGNYEAYMCYHHTPVNVTVYNNGEDFKGTVQVKVYRNTLSGNYVTYEKDADIVAGGVGEYNFTVYPETELTYFNVRVIDQSGNTVASTNAKVTALLPEQVMTAVVTDTKSSSLDYLNNLKIGDDIYNRSGYQTNYVSFLDGKTFPENGELLNSFSAIIIDDFNLQALSEKQIEAIGSWVSNGGLLVIGTGLNAEKTLKGFDKLFDYSLNGYDTTLCFGGTADTAVLDIPNSHGVDIQSGKEVTKSIDLGSGKILVHTFDLGADPIASMDTGAEYLSSFYRDTLPQKFSVERNVEYYPETLNSVNRLPSVEKDRLMILLAILGLYIIIVGPVCYFVLKKKDMREKGWIVIPIVAVVFSGIIFGISASSYQKDSLISFMSVTDLDLGQADTDISIGIRTPEKGTVSFCVNDDIEILDTGIRYNGYSYSNANQKNLLEYTVKESDDYTSITYYNQNSWQDNSVVTSSTNKYDPNSIEADFTVKGSSITGTVKNNFDFDLVDTIVTFAGQSYRVGYLASGESKEVTIPLSDEEAQKWSQDSYGMLRQLFYGIEEGSYNDSYVFRTGISTTEAYKIEQRFNLFNSLNNGNSSLGETGFKVNVAAFSEKPIIEGEKTINGKTVNENWENLYTKSFNVDLSKAENFDIPYGYIYADRVMLDGQDQSSGIDIYYYEIYTMSASEVVCEYSLPGAKNIDIIDISWENYDAFVNEPQIYDYSSDTWTNISSADLKSGAQKYISADGKLSLRADIYSDTSLALPKLSIKGGN